MTFSFRYKKYGEPPAKRPVVPFAIRGEKEIFTFGLVDSGADISTFSRWLLKKAGIKLKEESETIGIGQTKFKVKKGTATILFGKDREIFSIKMPVQTLAEESVPEDTPNILGRAGFFDEFEITFNERGQKIKFKENPSQVK